MEPLVRPVIYLDVDGCVNAFERDDGRHTLPRDTFDDFVWRHVADDDVCLSRQMAARLVDLTVYADICWLTTWRDHEVRQLEAVLGLPPWRWLDWSPTKFAAVLAEQRDAPRPFVWVDDDAIPLAAGQRFVDALGPSGAPRLLVRPRRFSGLTSGALDRISRFVQDNR